MPYLFNQILFILLFLIEYSYCQSCAPQVPCYPPPEDLARVSTSALSVTSTCGTPAENYCVVDDCSRVCNSSDPSLTHEKEFLIDSYDLPTYWKSKNFEEPVTLQLDINQRVILHQVILTFQYDMPNGVIIQRSQDFGNSYTNLAYYARRCLSTFQLPESPFYNGIDVLCYKIDTTTDPKQISYSPRRDPAVATQVLSGTSVRDYFVFTNVRAVLHEYYKPADFNQQTANPTKFYFAVRDFDVQGSCYCNGMGSSCQTIEYGKCMCEKNTQGDNCEFCLPLFNNKPWQFGVACEACLCNDHASSCLYDAVKSTGICQNCQHNTQGDKCDMCAAGYYRNGNVPLNQSNVCLDCGCSIPGVISGSSICNPVSGECLCKTNVIAGSICTECKDGFWKLDAADPNGCQDCQCSSVGTIGASTQCNKVSGQCPCLPGFGGRTCAICKDGFYGSQESSPSTCFPCDCSPNGSVNITCTITGQCHCKDKYYGIKCRSVVGGFFSGSIEQLTFNALTAMVTSSDPYTMNYTQAGTSSFTQVGYQLGLGTTGPVATSVTFSFELPKPYLFNMILQYQSSYTFENVSMVIQYQSDISTFTCDNGLSVITSPAQIVLVKNLLAFNRTADFGRICLAAGRYTVTVTIPQDGAGIFSSEASLIMYSLKLLPHYQHSYWYQNSNSTTQDQAVYCHSQAFDVIIWNQVRTFCARYFGYVWVFDSAMVCNCNPIGSNNAMLCEPFGGQCQCKPNIYDRQCTSCLPLHFNFASGVGCSACACHPSGSLRQSCDDVTGICSCLPNVIGSKCDACLTDHYGLSTGFGCSPCACSVDYSISSQCTDTGQCLCKNGVAGRNCTRCDSGYFSLTNAGCQRCNCEVIGSTSNLCDPVNGRCNCKAGASGARCEQCALGYYGYSADFPEACLPCQCSGRSQECDAASNYYLVNTSTILDTTESHVRVDGWLSVNEQGSPSGEVVLDWAPRFSIEGGYVKLTDTSNSNELFFSAPLKFLGDKRSAYMYSMTFHLSQETNASRKLSTAGDVILKAKGRNYQLITTLPSPPGVHQSFTFYTIRFIETDWRVNSTTGRVATNVELLDTLSDLSALWIRSKWTNEPNKFSGLAIVHMYHSTNDANATSITSVRALNVEQCHCIPPYGGQFCERCRIGYTRSLASILSNNGLIECVPCQCNNHSDTCDSTNGVCSTCLHQTTGQNCESCVDGYYGLATTGTPSDCKPCPCPGGLGEPNQFSNTCFYQLDDGLPTCSNCQFGYEGRNCDRCIDGYYGLPKMRDGVCRKCECNANVDPLAVGNCNRTTGECVKCLFNTTGSQCEWCDLNFYGDALAKTCQACSCNSIGSLSPGCNNVTGQCDCKANVIGRTCDVCSVNTYNFNSGNGCQLCNCNILGSLSQQCDVFSGRCQCKPRIIGVKCDQCEAGYYDISQGCLPCNCSASFTVPGSTCDPISGQCLCQFSNLGGRYNGRQCDQCGLNAIGAPPNCELCHSPCFDNWERFIAQESTEMEIIRLNASSLLSRFGGMSYEAGSQEINVLDTNLTYAVNVFNGAQYDTFLKEDQLRVIELTLIEYDLKLNQSKTNLNAADFFFKITMADYNGSVIVGNSIQLPLPSPFNNVRVRRSTVPVMRASPLSMMTLATGYIDTAKQNNASGYLIFSTIADRRQEIIDANNTLLQASSEVAQAMVSLANSALERTRVSSYLDQTFDAQFVANAVELNALRAVVQSVELLFNSTKKFHDEAILSLAEAQSVMNEAESKVNIRKNEANQVSQLASQMYVRAVTLKTNALMGKDRATDLRLSTETVQYDVNQSSSSVAMDVNKMVSARQLTEKAIRDSQTVLNMTIPVTLREIQALTNQIVTTIIDERQINQTYNGAAAGLQKAKDVQRLSQLAVNVSQATLDNIKTIETSLLDVHAQMNMSRDIQTENEITSRRIRNITVTVQNQFSNMVNSGPGTLQLINTAIQQLDDNLMCFSQANADVESITSDSQQGLNVSNEAARIHQSNMALLPQYTAQINAAFSTTSQKFTDVQQAHTDAVKLYDEVTEAERLLVQFSQQQSELDSLQLECKDLEAQLDTLVQKFYQASQKFEGCEKA